jgi:menaquinone-dependent protoporphyrinogen oxidase
MPEILIVFASTHGHTGRIAARIAAVLEKAGATADLRPAADAADCDPLAYDAVIVGGSVHLGHHQHELVAWAHRNARKLNSRPSAFFSVCLAVADATDEARDHAQGWIDDFADDTGWTPQVTASFAGALQYCEYDPFTRLLMRLMMARGDHPTDIREDVDYTDWAAVEAFAQTVADLAPTPTEAAL